MSPMAEDFYESNNTSYDQLSAYSGSSSVSSVPSSALYSTLKSLMVSSHTYVNSYNASKSLFQYTDCQGSGYTNNGKISSFYSGNGIGPSWDGSSWNREHTWPNSKGLGGSDEDDIMMLRPTAMSENSSRGNTAYGKSSGYYNPNSESGGAYDLRGDVARIFLYVYVRWGNVNNAWGSGGVMESVAVLLEWMEADPVDTWELGRNDSVESITGTRNVFVDYPELAFLLFGAEIPDDMSTPSGVVNQKCNHNNYDSGVVFVATCTENGYTLYSCQTAGCTSSYKANFNEPTGHIYEAGVCTVCGEAEETEPVKPTYVSEIVPGEAYKLGLFSTAKNLEYYFSGKMSGYYGATDTAYENAVDMYVETTSGGYYLYFNDDNGKKQYVSLEISGTHYNFVFGETPKSVFTWDSAKKTLVTTLGGEVCCMGTFDTYVTVGVLRGSLSKDTDYIARFYTYGEGGNETPGGNDTPGGDTTEPCSHNYDAVVIDPNCTNEGYTTYTCLICAHSYVGDIVAPNGHNYVNNVCTDCGAEKNTNTTQTSATISFANSANRTVFNTSQQVWEENGITVTNDKANSQSDVADYCNPGRFYMGSNVTIEYPGITKIEINCTGLADKYVSGWTNVSTAGATVTNNGGIVTIVFNSPVDTVVFTRLSAQSRAYSITVYAEAEAPSSCNHTNTEVQGALDPTCTTDGHTGKTVCLDCNATVDAGQVIRATKHVWTEADCDTPKTCYKCNATDGDALGHDWTEATEDQPKTCTRCGATEGDKLPGTGNTPDDDTPTDEPDDEQTPDNKEDDEQTTDGDAKDHSQCKANGLKTFWNALTNFFRRLFTGRKKCVCGEFYD